MEFSADVPSFESMNNNREGCWIKLPTNPEETNLNGCLDGGQAFHWIKTDDNEWTSTIEYNIVSIREKSDTIEFSVHKCPRCTKGTVDSKYFYNLLCNYLRLDVDLGRLLEYWKSRDARFSDYKEVKGIRILRQDPFITTLSFICSSNNNIKRIKNMVVSLSTRYGRFVCEHKGKEFFAFPTPRDLYTHIDSMQDELRSAGFGYRSTYLHHTIKYMHDNYNDRLHEWFKSLEHADYEHAIEELQKLHGVGRKIADCVALYGLNKMESIPIDTHLFKISKHTYKIVNKDEKLNRQNYQKIRKFFETLFIVYPGWAQSVLFVSAISI